MNVVLRSSVVEHLLGLNGRRRELEGEYLAS